MRASPPPIHAKVSQRGAALMIMIVIMVVGVASILVGALSSSALQSARQERTSAALAQAKDALIGRAVSDDNMPGSLPCPDTDDDGSAELFSGNHCPNYIGRLPWRTLGLPDLRDGNGERLWYALSAAFRNHSLARPLNSNTKGTLLVYSANGVSLQTEAGYDAVAVIFAPGSVLGSQTRSNATEQNNTANYLDIANSRNNSSSSGPFIAGDNSETFNDQLLFITTRSLIPLVEQRVAGEVKRALTNYYTEHGYYPWADSVDQATDYDSNTGLNRGWLPENALPDNWAGTSSPPAWFFENRWYTLIYYSVAESHTRPPTSNCTSCIDSTLSVNGVSGVHALFFMPGTPSGTLVRTVTNLSHYLESSQNYDDANDLYVTPATQVGNQDRLYLLP